MNDIQLNGLENYVTYTSYMPHVEVLQHQSTSQLLLLAVNDVPSAKGIITGKIFEYLATGKPILALVPPDGVAAELINRSGTGFVVPIENIDTIKNKILQLYNEWERGTLNIQPDQKIIDTYSRKSLTGELSKIFNNLTGE